MEVSFANGILSLFMRFFLSTLVTTYLVEYCSSYSISKQQYLNKRNALIDIEKHMRTGGALQLNYAELKLNDSLMKWKLREIQAGYAINGTFPPAMHFFKAKKLIEQSRVFQLIQLMPKGGALHVHDSSAGDMMWLVKNATYDKHCYMCINSATGQLLFKFLKNPTALSSSGCPWQSVVDLRSRATDPESFDEMLYRNLTLVVDDPAATYRVQADIWKRFMSLFQTSAGLIFYAPIFRSFFYECLQEFYNDGVQFIELRGLLPQVYELDGTTHDIEWTLKTYNDVTQQFMQDHPDFIGLRFIYTSGRTSSNDTEILSAIKTSVKFLKKYPDLFAGYDIVGDENKGRSLLSYIDELLYPSQHNVDLPYFFHAGETVWEDSSADMDILDAVLLNTTRVGHGYSEMRHPIVMKLIHEHNIAVEVCPISNQVLMLVKDLRNHPAGDLMSRGHPVVISSDDPGLWGAQGLSYDFYEALMGLGGAWGDLATLKQLALNSISYSSLSSVQRARAMEVWQKKWDEFINKFLNVI